MRIVTAAHSADDSTRGPWNSTPSPRTLVFSLESRPQDYKGQEGLLCSMPHTKLHLMSRQAMGDVRPGGRPLCPQGPRSEGHVVGLLPPLSHTGWRRVRTGTVTAKSRGYRLIGVANSELGQESEKVTGSHFST